MARLQRFMHSVATGYAVLVANIVYTFASVPLALHYLGKEDFGLWAVALTVSGYLGLIDLGMSAAFARLLIDHKDRPDDGGYGGMIQTACLVLLAQAALILVLGTTMSFCLGPLLDIPTSLGRTFTLLMILQAATMALGFATKIFSQVLYAHHRLDIQNYGQILQFVTGLGVMWLAFRAGAGVFSLVWANAIATVVAIVACAWGCLHLRLFPARGCWGRPTWSGFRELFAYGSSIFFINLGNQLVHASQAVIVTRWMGLDAAATWTVCTRLFTLVCQIAWRPLEYSYSLLSEMIARGEREQLRRRFDALVTLTLAVTVVGAAAFAVCNQPFVTVWTSGKIAWAAGNDVLLAVWLLMLTIVRCTSYLIQASKQLGFLQRVFFVEGIAFVALAFAGIRWGGFAGVVASSIVCTAVVSCVYTVRRATGYFSTPLHQALWEWLSPAAKIAAFLIPIAAGMSALSAMLSAGMQLAINATVTGIAGVVLLSRFACTDEMKAQLQSKLPPHLWRLFSAMAGG